MAKNLLDTLIGGPISMFKSDKVPASSTTAVSATSAIKSVFYTGKISVSTTFVSVAIMSVSTPV